MFCLRAYAFVSVKGPTSFNIIPMNMYEAVDDNYMPYNNYTAEFAF